MTTPTGCGRLPYRSYYLARTTLRDQIGRLTPTDVRTLIQRCNECQAWHLEDDSPRRPT